MAIRTLPDREYVREALDYDPDTGEFHWRERPSSHFANPARQQAVNRTRVGSIAGNKSRYIKIILGYRKFYAHRLAWLLMHGEPVPVHIDHIDGDGFNNRIANLRAASMAQNIANSKTRYDSTTGVKGVWKRGSRFQVKITVNYRQMVIGTYDTIEEATEARREAAIRLHGKFARHT